MLLPFGSTGRAAISLASSKCDSQIVEVLLFVCFNFLTFHNLSVGSFLDGHVIYVPWICETPTSGVSIYYPNLFFGEKGVNLRLYKQL